jgi:glutamate:GABA antiporter
MYYILFASITVIWCISMVFLFIDIIVIRYKYHEMFTNARLSPDWVFYLCSVVGLLASGVGLYATVTAPWVPTLIDTRSWDIWIAGIVVVSLIAAATIYFLGHARIRDDVSDEQALAVAMGTAEGTAEKA